MINNITYTVVLSEGHPGVEDDWRLQEAILVSGGTVHDDTDKDEYESRGDIACGLMYWCITTPLETIVRVKNIITELTINFIFEVELHIQEGTLFTIQEETSRKYPFWSF